MKLQRSKLLRTIALLVICLTLLPTNLVSAESYPGISMVFKDVPQEIDKDVPFSIKATITNVNDHEGYIPNCIVTADFQTPRAGQQDPTLVVQSGSLTTTKPGVPQYTTGGNLVKQNGIKQIISFISPVGDSIIDIPTEGKVEIELSLITQGSREDIDPTYWVSEPDDLTIKLECPFQVSDEDYEVATSGKSIHVSDGIEPKPEPEPEEENPLITVKLPATFTLGGSQTTQLKELTEEELSKVSNFIIDILGNGRIEFLEDLDLSSEDTRLNLEILNEFLEITTGRLSLNTESLEELNKEARIYFYNLDLVPTADFSIYTDNQISSVESISYDEESRTLSFNVDGFSTYAIGPGLTVTEQEDTSTTEDHYTIMGSVIDLDSSLEIIHNDTTIEESIEISEDGTFSVTIILGTLVNTFTVKATSVGGITEEISFEVTKSPGNSLLGIEFDNPLLLAMAIIIFILFVVTVAVVAYLVLGEYKLVDRLKKNKKESNIKVSLKEKPMEPVVNIPEYKNIPETRLPVDNHK